MLAHCKPFHLWVLALDEYTAGYLAALRLKNMTIVPLHRLEGVTPVLQEAKFTREWIEYIWTIKGFWMMYILAEDHGLQSLTYLDGDNFFFGNPQPVFDECADHPIGIIPHNFAGDYAGYGIEVGHYNAGFVYMARNALGIGCIKEWADKCLEWCYWKPGTDSQGHNLYVDQAYLDLWPAQWSAHPIEHLGAGLAPWNQANYSYSITTSAKIEAAGKFEGNAFFVENFPLLWFHFHKGLNHGFKLTKPINDYVYKTYTVALEQIGGIGENISR
jgi:hypothetical protein